ncbi:hypothetical protein A6A19_00360 [Actinobacillus delphinicola]|uniref:hypothetical protein n=1 Tax=Actinobacillus delphinicola TaxID=51161 RepID=UPI00244335F8|nr:hypothetical protein [Actinobacillus delphinicola]MDG6896498.1 hypothetical protein [Actinobacillus delphinicola]
MKFNLVIPILLFSLTGCTYHNYQPVPVSWNNEFKGIQSEPINLDIQKIKQEINPKDVWRK